MVSFEWIKNFFPIKTKSLDEFIDIVERERGEAIEAEPGIKLKNGTSTHTSGFIGNFQYSVQFTSRTQTGRRIVFHEIYGTRFGSEYGVGDGEERGKAALRMVLTADDRLQRIKARLPNVRTDIVGLDEQAYQRMHPDAAEKGLKPY